MSSAAIDFETDDAVAVDARGVGTRAEPAVRPPRPRQNRGDRVFFGVLAASALVGPALLAMLLAVLLYGAWPAIRAFGVSFVTSGVWEPREGREQYGAFPFIVGTLVSSILALCIAGPVGVAVATFIGEVVPKQIAGTLRFVIEILATVPSVVYGLWGVFVLAPFVTNWIRPAVTHAPLGYLPFFAEPRDPRNMLCAVLILSIMILPMIVSVSLDAIRAVPSLQREAALGLGATRWEMIRVAVWPSARTGFVGGSILALGRAVGETMAVTMVIGNGRRISASLLAASDTVASTIANQFAEAPSDLFTAALIEMALLLLLVTLAVNVGARLIIRRFAADTGARQ
jgi:phosphate transport system permease protein